MTTLQGVLAGAGLVAVLMGLFWRVFVHFDRKSDTRFEDLRRENREAHAGINQRIEQQGQRIEQQGQRIERQGQHIERQGETLHAIARDVSFLAGRQAERDQAK